MAEPGRQVRFRDFIEHSGDTFIVRSVVWRLRAAHRRIFHEIPRFLDRQWNSLKSKRIAEGLRTFGWIGWCLGEDASRVNFCICCLREGKL